MHSFGEIFPFIRGSGIHNARAEDTRELFAALSGFSRASRVAIVSFQRRPSSHPPAISAGILHKLQFFVSLVTFHRQTKNAALSNDVLISQPLILYGAKSQLLTANRCLDYASGPPSANFSAVSRVAISSMNRSISPTITAGKL
jgi:hypothetical protein